MYALSNTLFQHFQVKLIAKFFRRHKVKQHYEGHAILKLIETRWVGHQRATKSIRENYVHMMKTLPQITGAAGFDGDDVALAAGISHIMASLEFVFVLVFTKDLLQMIEPVTKALQGREIGYKDSMPLIRAVYTTIEKMRTPENFEKYYGEAMKLQRGENLTQPSIASDRPIRDRRQSTMLNDSVVEETLGQRSESSIVLKSSFYETIDIILIEMTNRFVKNDAILSAIDTAEEMDLEKLRPLTELGIALPTQIELDIAKKYLDPIRKKNEELNKLKNPKDKKIKTIVLTELYKVRQGMANVYSLFAAIETFPSGTAVCESSFSALTRIMRPQRISMMTNRLNNLSFLAFEHKKLVALNLDAVLKRFDSLKNRKVQLF